MYYLKRVHIFFPQRFAHCMITIVSILQTKMLTSYREFKKAWDIIAVRSLFFIRAKVAQLIQFLC